MIHEIAIELQTALRAVDCPLAVVERESTKTTTFGRERIVLEHAEGGGDTFGAVRGTHVNPKHRFTRTIALQVTIYAQSLKAGALEWEHRRRAEHILDLAVVAIDDIAKRRRNTLVLGGGGFIVPEDLQDSERHGGAIYQLSLTFDRAIHAQTWAYEIQPEVTVGGADGVAIVTGQRRLSADGTNFEEF